MDATARIVFERFPHGLLVTDAAGVVVASNDRAGRLLGRPELVAECGRTCCSLLGCRTPGGPLAEVCITERALAAGGPLPEVRVDVEAPDHARAVWVTAAPIREGQVLLELRPGVAGDRRRRTDPHWTAGPALRISVLGRTRVESPEGPLEGAWLRQRPGQLLKLLVCNRARVTHTDEIAMTFWPASERTAMQNVRYFVHELRTQLEPNREKRVPSSFVVAHEGGYGLDALRVRVDADDFEEHARAGLRAAGRGEDAEALPALEAASALYRGELLADEPYAEWAFAERARLHHLACTVVGELASIAVRAGRPDAAIGHLSRLADMEPLDGEIQRRLIGALLENGRSGEAVRRYKLAQAAFMDAFEESPDFTVAELRRQLRAGAPAAPQPVRSAATSLA